MKKFIVAVLSLVLVFSLAACGGSKAKERGQDEVVVTMPVGAEPEAGFDPAYGWGAGEHVHEPLIQSTLTVTGKNMEIEKDLATEYSASDDGKVWTVKIRDGVKFSNGEPLTAKDVAFTYNNCRDHNDIADFTMLKEAKAIDDHTVEFILDRPYSPWPYTMAVVGIVPEKGYSKDYGQHPVGSGRYILKQWDKGQQAIFEANPDYYGEKPKIKKLTVLFMDDDAALAAAKAGEVDVAQTNATYAKDVKIKGYSILVAKTVDNRVINLPAEPVKEKDGIKYGNDFTSDVNVRRTINIGIDRKKIIDEVLNGYGSPAYSVCDQMPWYNKDSKVEYDKEKAIKLLEDNGWKLDGDTRSKDGVKAELTIIYPQDDAVRQGIAENLAGQLGELGIKVKTDAQGWDTAYDNAQSEPLVWGWGTQSPMELYNIYHTSSQSPFGYAEYSPYKNETVDKYMDEAMAEMDPEKSNELWRKAQWDGKTGVIQPGDIPWVWICNIDHLYFVKDGLKIADQKIHPHGHGWTILNNVDQWSW